MVVAGAGLDGLLREVRRQTRSGDAPDERKVLHWLRRQTSAQVALVEYGATVRSCTTGFPREVLPALAALLERMAGGQLASAATETEQLHVHCEALGSGEPHPVLVVAGVSKPTPEAISLTSHAGSVLTLLRRAEDGDLANRGYQDKARQVRLGVLHALLAGEPVLARRMNSGAVPPLLEATGLRIYLLRCPQTDRDRLPVLHQDPAGFHGGDLMVHCPVINEHLICLVAEREGQGDPGLAGLLRRLVRDNPGYALGISAAQPLNATAAAYSQAVHALAAARTTADRVASYHGRSRLEGVLAQRPALNWARALLRPLDSVPKTSADITRLVMGLPRSGVARLLGLSRNTVAAHLGRVERALELDLDDVRDRATVNLALALTGSCAGADADDRQRPQPLDELMRAEAVFAWADSLLRPLQARHRRTLQGWIDANADAQQAARRLDISRNTVRAHLLAAETALSLDLLTIGSGIYDVVHALDITAARTG
ncbi:helix-turn-helix domain-containing protein [Saccharopolyspora sp. HNM0986]|uniref:helix-turn-helix domain-containing protein n=1 Tax=Saccharopolyspora galaxeae TaxID=2781241 RepID=UPI00190BF6A6|nr:helix-turn-helix domain-containing protein [Saccharopolyspora sp. HNM0986]MBK0868965.1 helix-turn-helix domain-containing protein [Saccharopolyspora sp. HNM0986]